MLDNELAVALDAIADVERQAKADDTDTPMLSAVLMLVATLADISATLERIEHRLPGVDS